MTYQIQSKSDLSTGVSLVIRVPEKDVDHKAMRTLLADSPDFILPFRYKSIDGEIEFIYHAGTLSKLTHLSASRSPGEYAELWSGILNPLLECDDWFMNPYCFLLKTEYLYINKNTKSLCYLYIPSKQACSDYNSLTEMVKEVSKQNPVTDTDLQNKVLWSIMDRFNPKEFLQMMKPYEVHDVKTVTDAAAVELTSRPAVEPKSPENMQAALPDARGENVQNKMDIGMVDPLPLKENSLLSHGELTIDLSGAGKKAAKEKPAKEKGKGLFGGKKEKEVKPKEAKPKASGGLFGKKKVEQEILMGATATQTPKAAPVHIGAPAYTPPVNPAINMLSVDDPITELDEDVPAGVRLRYIGNGAHPKNVGVNIPAGSAFAIGRFDIAIGRSQSDFEFDQSTKAVSRRHAVIERGADGYQIIDLSSAAGTFVNGQRLLANTPFKLVYGCRISFGNAGADYIWEE